MMNDSEFFAQLQKWRDKGYDPQLWGTPKGWKVILDSLRWAHPTVNEDTSDVMRFSGAWYPTPQAAIEAALQVIQP